MKNKLLKAIIMLSKCFLYGFVLQTLLLNLVLALNASGQYRTIEEVMVTLSAEQLSLEQFFSEVQKQTPFKFSHEHLDVDRQLMLNFARKKGPVIDFLREAAQQSNLSFRQVNHGIDVLKSKDNGLELISIAEITISGKVVDDKGEPLPGATVTVVGTTTGTVTDLDGNYALTVPEGSTLIFSYIGYEPMRVLVDNRTKIDVTLKPDLSSLDEVVVVGYGSQNRRDVTGSIVSLKNKDIKYIPLPNIDQRLQGQVAGLQVTQTSGNPGGGVVMRIRGAGTIGNNQPLFVVDGFPIGSDFNSAVNPLSTISPSDIESIEVLKDASSTAIYGSRGANGVVLITTKKGSAGKTIVDINISTGMQTLPKKIPLLNAEEMVELYKESRNNAYIDRKPLNQTLENWLAVPENSPQRGGQRVFPYFDRPASEFGVGTDWQDEIFRAAPINQLQLSVSGGSPNTKFLISGDIFDQEGIVIESWFKRYSFRANVDSKVNDRIKIGLSIAPSYAQSRIANTQGHFNNASIITTALLMSPTIPVYNEDGTYGQQLGRTDLNLPAMFNPVALAKEAHRYRNTGRLLSNAFVEVDIIKNLSFRSSLGIDFTTFRNTNFTTSQFGGTAPNPPSASANSANNISWLNENVLTYNFSKNDHSVNAVAGISSQKFFREGMNVSRNQLPNDLIPYVVGPADGGQSNGEEWSLLSYLARVNYSYKQRYLLTLTTRRDGSSRFGQNNKWGTFPSAALGWIISEESFLKNNIVISDLKLRASYGVAGNFEIGNYESFALMGAGQYVGGVGAGEFVNSFSPISIGNPDLTWETSYKSDIGLDIGFKENRFRITVDYYRNLTKDMLLNVAIPSASGFLAARQNVGSIENKGWEFSFAGDVVRNTNFTWSTNFNISYNRNEVLSLGEFGERIFANPSSAGLSDFSITQVGHPLGSFYGMVRDGIFLSQEEADSYVNTDGQKMQQRARGGDVRWVDVDGNGIVDGNDRMILGSPLPDYIFGINNTFSYKNWDFSVLISGTQGNEIMNLPLRWMTNMNANLTQHAMARNRWRSEADPGDGNMHRAVQNPNSPIPGQSEPFPATNQNPDQISSFYVEDGSFIRLRNAVLGYNISGNALSRLRLSRARIYITGTNLLTLTGYRGYDPETNERGNDALSQGVDLGGYPQARSYMVGVNISF